MGLRDRTRFIQFIRPMAMEGEMRKEEGARARPLLRLSCGCNEMSFVLFPPVIVDDGR